MLAAAPPPTGWRAAWERITRLLPWAVDAAVVAGVALVALFDVFVAGGAYGFTRPLAALGSVAVVAVRRWAALPGFVILLVGLLAVSSMAHTSFDLTTIPPFTPVVALSALVPTIVRREPVPVAVLAGGAGAIAVIAAMTWPADIETQVITAILFGGAYVVGVGLGVYLRHLDDAQVRAADDARRAERLDLARELHDLVAHYVTGIVVQAQAAQVIADRDPAAAGVALERIEGAGRDALVAMRGMVGTLRGASDGAAAPTTAPVALDDLGGLDELAERSRATGLPVSLAVAPDAGRVARGAVAASTHRIVQESLTNVHRHAVDPTQVAVDVRLAEGALVVTVTDDGRQPVGGPDDRTLTGAGFGLVGMTERALALTGGLRAGPLDPPEHGWRVQAWLPLTPEVR